MLPVINSGQILPGFLSGLILLSVIYNIILALSFKDKSFLYLGIFFIAGGISLLLISRNDFQHSLMSVKILPFLLFIALASVTEYSRLNLKVKSLNALWEKVLTGERNLLLSGIVISVIINSAWFIGITAILAPAAILTIVVTGIISYKSGNKSAVLDAVLWSLFFLSLAPLVLWSFALFPDVYRAVLSIQIGFMLLILLTPFTVSIV